MKTSKNFQPKSVCSCPISSLLIDIIRVIAILATVIVAIIFIFKEAKAAPTRDEVKQEIIRQAKMYSVDETTALRIVWCESRYDALAVNKKSGAKGVYQYLDSTWKNVSTSSPFDHKENIKQFMRNYPSKPYAWQCK